MARKTYEIAFELAGKIGASFGNMFTSAKDRLGQVNRQLSSLQRETKTLDRSLKDGKITAEQYAQSYAKIEKQLKQTEQAQKKLTKATKAEQLAQKSDKFRGTMEGALMGATGAAFALGAPVYAAMQFESSMADVRKVVDFDVPEQFKEMEQDILNLSKRIPMAASGLAQIVAAGGQAGIAREDLIKFADAAAKMGVAFDITADEAGQMMAEWRSAFKMNQEQVNTLADQINYLGNTTAASAPKISDVVRRIGPLGEVGGAAASQIAALGATMVGAGVAEEVAATGIKNMILSLVAGENATKKQAEAMQALGFNTKEMAQMMQQDAEGAIMSVFQALQKLPKERQASVLATLFGKESIGAIAPLLTNLDGLQENLKKVADETQYAGSMEKEFQARSETTENSLQLLKNQVAALGINIGSLLLPHVVNISKKLSVASERLAAFAEKHPTLTKALLIAATVLTGLTIAVAGLGIAFSLVISPVARFYAWATKVELMSKLAAGATKAWAAAQRVLNFVMGMNPIMRVITLIASLIAIGVTLYNNFESIRNMVDSVWARFKETFPGAAQLIETVGSKVSELWNKLKGFWKWLTGGGSGGAAEGGDIPGYATGTRYHPGGPALVGERGPELLNLPRGSQVIPLSGSGGNTVIRLNFAPVIHGAGPEIIPALERQQQSFLRQLENVMHQQRRVAYG